MAIVVADDPWGFRIRLYSGPQFQSALSLLKELIPRRQRDYREGTWFVHRRGEKRLARWLSKVEDLGVRVVRQDCRGQVSSKVA
jgi:hypothetical protein